MKISKEKLSELLNCKSENNKLDFKEVYKFDENKEKLELVRDIVSFANTKGGYIVFGVEDGSWEPIGLDSKSSKINDIQINDFVKKFVEFNLNVEASAIKIEDKFFGIIYIPQFDIRLNKNNLLEFKKDGEYDYNDYNGNRKKGKIFNRYQINGRDGTSNKVVNGSTQFLVWRESKDDLITNFLEISRPYTKYIHRDNSYDELLSKFKIDNIRVIQIRGLGGIGKTSFVYNFCDNIINKKLVGNEFNFDYIIWVTGKLTVFKPSGIIETIAEEELTYSEFIMEISRIMSLDDKLPVEEKVIEINRISEFYKILYIVDNMETINDERIHKFLQTLPSKSKIILTSRESIKDYEMARINLNGFELDEAKKYFEQQLDFFGVDKIRIGSILSKEFDDVFNKTYGAPIILNMIAYQISEGASIGYLLNGLNAVDQGYGKLYDKAMEFCFDETFSKLNILEKKLLFIFSIPFDTTKSFSISDLRYILNNIDSEVLHEAIIHLSKLSFIQSKGDDYFSPSLVKLFAMKVLSSDKNIDILNIKSRYAELVDFDLESFNNDYYVQFGAFTYEEKVIAKKLKSSVDRYYITRNYEQFEESLKDLISESPEFAHSYFELAKIQIDNEIDSIEIIKNFEKAVNANPKSDYYWAEFAFYESSKHTRIALKYFENALRINPGNNKAHHGMAVALVKIKTINKNFPKYNESIINEHFNNGYCSGAKFNLKSYIVNCHAHALFNYQIEEYTEALKICDNGLEKDFNNASLLALRGNILKKLDPEFVGKTKITQLRKGVFATMSDEQARRLLKNFED